jgi:hypothetical protein
MSNLEDYTIHATDGNIGHVKDFYFDDDTWVIRYLVVEASNWLLSRKVLISPIAITAPNWSERELPVSITKEQVKNSPDFDTEKPVSRQYEADYLNYYGYPLYWGAAGLWGDNIDPGTLLTGLAALTAVGKVQTQDLPGDVVDSRETALKAYENSHLRSCKAVTGYRVEASDGDVGRISGMLIEEDTWTIRYLIIDTGSWWLGHQMLVAPKWIETIRWPEESVSVNMTRAAIQGAPAYDWTVALNREQEIRTHEYYGFSGYWTDEAEHDAEIA